MIGGGGQLLLGMRSRIQVIQLTYLVQVKGRGVRKDRGDSASARLEPSMGFVAYFLGNFSDQSVISSFSP